MMQEKRAAIAGILGLFLCVPVTFAQQEPPQIIDVDSFILRNVTGEPFGFYLPEVPFDLNTELARETDIVRLRFTVQLPVVQGGGGGGGGNQQDQGPFYNLLGVSIPLAGYPAPLGPPLPDATTAFQSLRRAGTNFVENNGIATFNIDIYIPQFQGRNQARLLGFIPWDVRYLCQILLSSTQDPGCNFNPQGLNFAGGCREPVSGITFPILVIEHPNLGPPNPPPFADAGPDQTVQVGNTAILDGSRTFDGFNVGFGDDATRVIDQDQLEFTWEWISGPERVEPIVRDPVNAPAIAEVNFNTVGVYVYRLTVDDGVNAFPTQDSVTINVVSVVPENRGPRARINGPSQAVIIGGIIQLDGTSSSDPDGNPLTFRWRQTNELGGSLSTTEIRTAFQPLSGLESPVSTWQAVRPGTYYFRLIVSDGQLQDVAETVVRVVSAGTAGVVVMRLDESGQTFLETPGLAATETVVPGDSDDALSPMVAPGLCGFGLMPVALLPLALAAMRRRH